MSFEKDSLFTKGLKDYLLRDRREDTLRWIDKIYVRLPELMEKWGGYRFVRAFDSSRFGLVIEIRASENGSAIVKLIPPFLNRYDRELEAMKILPAEYMTGLLDHDDSLNAILLKKVENAEYGTFDKKNRLNKFYSLVFEKAKKYSVTDDIKYIPDYYKELIAKRDSLPKVPYMRGEAEKSLFEAIYLYEKYFMESDKYIIHRDLHQYNILDDGTRFYGVDPVGNIAPKEFECVRYMRNIMRGDAEHYSDNYRIMMDFFSHFADPLRISIAFIIDAGFHVVSSTFEHEDPTETVFTLDVIRTVKNYIEK